MRLVRVRCKCQQKNQCMQKLEVVGLKDKSSGSGTRVFVHGEAVYTTGPTALPRWLEAKIPTLQRSLTPCAQSWLPGLEGGCTSNEYFFMSGGRCCLFVVT